MLVDLPEDAKSHFELGDRQSGIQDCEFSKAHHLNPPHLADQLREQYVPQAASAQTSGFAASMNGV